MRVAILGCGYVADFYMATCSCHPELELCGVFDRDPERLGAFRAYYGVNAFESLDALLHDASIEMVINLTNPRSHYETNRACLLAGKHVYSEKPVAMDPAGAAELMALAQTKGVALGSAPCSVLGETAQTIWHALSAGAIGTVRLVYVNFDAGMTSRQQPWNWRSCSGAQWPAKDEFEVGCTYEHAAYFLTWLVAFFGPVRRVTAFASCQIPDKGIAVDSRTPDFTLGCLEFDERIVARATTSIVAPLDKSLMIVGDEGVLYTKDIRDDAAPVYIRHHVQRRLCGAFEYRFEHWRTRWERWLNWIPWNWGHHWQLNWKVPFARKPTLRSSGRYKPIDFCRGPVEMVSALQARRPHRLSASLAIHVTEVIQVLQYPERFGFRYDIRTTCDRMEPLLRECLS
ncbi:MAG: Gfo/Idh/MocA family oxidoreductase [Deltaproteobacteria bacterium]|nr:Gfo/Idh/MocA family oxidoreductase [Deltaproteobacteria bacterium]